MFIPIDAKADIEGSKKGKLTPAQHAQLNAWCLASKTGILDIYNNTTKEYERCEATETNYTATDNKATVVFKKGYIVICGRLVECEAGTKVDVATPSSGKISGKIILRYSLSAVKEDEFVVETKVGSLIQQDLNDNPLTGVYEFELYSYKATPTTVMLTRANIDYVPDIGGKLNDKLEEFEKGLFDRGKPLNGYDYTKGTIEERFSRLGFNDGFIYSQWINEVGDRYEKKKVGNICKLGKVIYGQLIQDGKGIGPLNEDLVCDKFFDGKAVKGPKKEFYISWIGRSNKTNDTVMKLKIWNKNGYLAITPVSYIDNALSAGSIRSEYAYFAYESE